MCVDHMMMVDAKGGDGLAGVHNMQALDYDKTYRRGASLLSSNPDKGSQKPTIPDAPSVMTPDMKMPDKTQNTK